MTKGHLGEWTESWQAGDAARSVDGEHGPMRPHGVQSLLGIELLSGAGQATAFLRLVRIFCSRRIRLASWHVFP